MNCHVIGLKIINKENNDKVTNDSPPMNVVWYLSIISRVKCMFLNPIDVRNLR